MKKNKTYKFISLTMALLMFFSSSGMAIDIHLCQGKIKEVNLLGKAKSCSEISRAFSNCNSENLANSCSSNDNHDGCCNNQSVELDLDFDSVEIVIQNITDSQVKFVKAFVCSFFVETIPSTNLDNYTNYFPPPLERDITVLFQTFLI